jgi:hypothetical protein
LPILSRDFGIDNVELPEGVTWKGGNYSIRIWLSYGTSSR